MDVSVCANLRGDSVSIGGIVAGVRAFTACLTQTEEK